MQTSLEVANYFIRQSLKTGIELTPMKLIKLSYIAHGFHLGIYSKELLDEAVYAWQYGPVIETLYYKFREYKDCQIDELHRDKATGVYPMPRIDVVPLLEKIWNTYGQYDGITLSAMTHQEGTPWDITWNKVGGKNKRSAVIPNDLIEEYYEEKLSSASYATTA